MFHVQLLTPCNNTSQRLHSLASLHTRYRLKLERRQTSKEIPGPAFLGRPGAHLGGSLLCKLGVQLPGAPLQVVQLLGSRLERGRGACLVAGGQEGARQLVQGLNARKAPVLLNLLLQELQEGV